MLGRWDISTESQVFLGIGDTVTSRGEAFPMGVAISSSSLQSGSCSVHIRFSEKFGQQEQAAGLVLGYQTAEQRYVFAELGAAKRAYSIGEYVNGYGWRPLAAAGQLENLSSERDYLLQVTLTGQELTMLVDGITVLQHLLPEPLMGRQLGLIAAGAQKVSFTEFKSHSDRPKAFVAMQFGEPYFTLYRDVIREQVGRHFEVILMDETAGPGMIIEDIRRGIEQADIVIAEITPANPNVFYEVGYAHALKKPTILLAKRGSVLPFDIQSFRVVFYNDTIGGKAEIEHSLQNHLKAVAGR